ncbi:hypothetical protein [Paenibacillus naphthalenovorans]|uniref:hypothetical protein n=1 Tax=Paenibacillus naphthalenovorans TaxID=162209 RepID=UPI003D271EF1
MNSARKINKEVIQSKFSHIFGGMYFDHLIDGGVLKIGIVNSQANQAAIKEIADKILYNDKVQFYNTKYTYSQLKEKLAEINNFVKNNPQLPISYTSLSVRNNNIIVALKQTDDNLTKNLNDLFGAEFLNITVDNPIVTETSRSALTRPLNWRFTLEYSR